MSTASSALASGAFRAITVSPLSSDVRKTDDGSKPAHHAQNGFVNPWPSFREKYKRSMGPRVMLNQICNQPPIPKDISTLIPVHTPTWGSHFPLDTLKATWLGHACFLLELPAPPGASRGPRIIFDPALSKRCFSSEYLGPERITPVPCKIEEIPQVDAIVLSHNHYDHTDTSSLRTLLALHAPAIFAPLGNAPYLTSCGFAPEDVHVLDWWEACEVRVELPRVSVGPQGKAERGDGEGGGDEDGGRKEEGVRATFKLTCTPCQHFSGRSINDRGRTLWASWAIEEVLPSSSPASSAPVVPPLSFSPLSSPPASSTPPSSSTSSEAVKKAEPEESAASRPPKKAYFAGDTAYRTLYPSEDPAAVPVCPAFREIGQRLGPFDLAFIPIGAYDPAWLFSNVHASPADSVAIFGDVRARKALAMHWGTWILTTEPVMDPPALLREECAKAGVPEGDFDICGLGETRVF